MNGPTNTGQKSAMWAVFGIGFLLLVIAMFFDPIGTSPDTGLFDFGPTGTKWLLGGLGLFFVGGGVGLFIQQRSSGSK